MFVRYSHPMSLLNRLKSVLGLGQSSNGRADDPVAVTVEREPDVDTAESDTEIETEPAVDDESDVDTAESDTEIKTEPAVDDESDDGDADAVPVTEISGIGPAYGERLEGAGISTVADLAAADASSLAESTEIAEGRVSGWIEAAHELE